MRKRPTDRGCNALVLETVEEEFFDLLLVGWVAGTQAFVDAHQGFFVALSASSSRKVLSRTSSAFTSWVMTSTS